MNNYQDLYHHHFECLLILHKEHFLFGNFNQNNDNINNRSEIIWNNNIDSNNILNKSFDADFSQDKNINRKDSLNNSSYSFIDLQSKN